MSKHNAKISIILPVKNEEKGLEELINNLIRQRPEPDEIIVIDAGSKDKTPSIVQKFANTNPRIKYLLDPKALPGQARNTGIATTQADIIVQIDGGCTVRENWLLFLVEPILNNRADFVTGNILPMPIKINILNQKYDLGNIFWVCSYKNTRSKKRMAGGASVAYYRELWEKVWGFPEGIRCCEDVLFIERINRLGIRHEYSHNSKAYWQVGPGFRDIFLRQIRYTKYNIIRGHFSKNKKRILSRTLLLFSLALLSIFWLPLISLLIVIVLLFFIKTTLTALSRYFIRIDKPVGIKFVILYLIISYTRLVLLSAEEIGLCLGLWSRIVNNNESKLLREYERNNPNV